MGSSMLTQRGRVSRLAGALTACLLVAGAAVAETLPSPYDAFRMVDAAPAHQIPLLGDRFRIDDHIDEITMVFFRDPTSRSVVLILPDGSKWYSTRHPEQVEWETGPGFDQVKIKTPMRGPWQVSGDLRAESRLLVMSDLQFNAEPLPNRVYQGERLPITGAFTEAGQPIEQRDFRSAIELALYLVSTNEEQYENFDLNPRQVGHFKDDGRDLDARARDGIFTGAIDFNVPTGAYIPSYRATTPLYQRNFEQSPIYVSELPITVEVEQGGGEQPVHQVRFVADEYYVDPEDLIIRGEIVFPNGERQLIDRSTARGEPLVVSVTSSSYGTFTVRTTLYATARRDGREIVAQMQDVGFSVRPPAREPDMGAGASINRPDDRQIDTPATERPRQARAEGQADIHAEPQAGPQAEGRADFHAEPQAEPQALEGSAATATPRPNNNANDISSSQLPPHWIIALIVATNLLLVLIWFIIMWRRRR